jgi:hypothetical protein
MFVVILPFALLLVIVEWQQQIQIGASLLVIGFGIFRLVNRRHPRVLARIELGVTNLSIRIVHGGLPSSLVGRALIDGLFRSERFSC